MLNSTVEDLKRTLIDSGRVECCITDLVTMKTTTSSERCGQLQQLNELEERCDLNGLMLESVKYKNKLQGCGSIFDQVSTTLDTETLYRLKQWCALYNVRVETAVQFIWHRVLHVYGGGRHTVIGTAICPSYDLCLEPVDLKTVVVDHGRHSDSTVLDILLSNHFDQDQGSLSGQHLDSVMVISTSSEQGMKNHHFQRTPLVIFVVTGEVNDCTASGLEWIIRYDAEQFHPRSLRGLLNIVLKTAEEILQCSPGHPVSELDLVPAEQKLQLDEWNRETDGEFPESLRLNELFEQAAERYPNKLALTYNGHSMTYAELNKMSNKLAHYLHHTVALSPEQLVALFLDKSELTIITVLAVWKSGAAYVPIDQAFPDERVEFMLKDIETQHVICNRKHVDRLRGISSIINIIDLEPVLDHFVGEFTSETNLHLNISSAQLAYASYTSGTTGIPKAIGKRHRQVVNSVTDLAERYDMISKPEVVVLFSSYVFEPFLRQTLQALVNGHHLVIVHDDEKLDRTRFPEFLRRYGVTYLNGTASVLREFDYSNCPSLERLILIGEQLTDAHYKKLRETYNRRIINEYGFTESAFVTTVKFFNDEHEERTDRSIGRPVRNVKCYILNEQLRQVPIGAVGELYIGGIGVSDGYLNRPDLTRQRFLANPYQTDSERLSGDNSRMYKTGDVARWLPNGDIEYLGRNDFQVKIRGVRIEPGEIESITCSFPGIKSCVVVVKLIQQQQQLVGYFVSETASPIDEHDVLSFLEKKLPRYMIPMRMVQLDNIPVTINGKVNLRVLPDVPALQEGHVNNVTFERNLMDKKLRDIWSEVLGIQPDLVGIDQSFFWLGGHSLSSIQLITRIRQQMHFELSIENVFHLKTIRRMSDFLEEKKQEKHEETRDLISDAQSSAVQHQNVYLANSLQQGFVYHNLKQREYDDAYVLQSIHVYRTKISRKRFQKAWEAAQRKYCSLRLRFSFQDEIVQIVGSEEEMSLDFRYIDEDVEISVLQQQDRSERYQLEDGRLCRIYLIRHNESNYSCMFSCHHAIIDGWSLIILYDFVHCKYLELLDDEESSLERDSPEIAYCQAQKYMERHRADNVDYWKSVIDRIDSRVDLNCLMNDTARRRGKPLNTYDHIESQLQKTIALKGAWWNTLRKTCNLHCITLHSLLQFVWHKVLYIYGGGGNGLQTVTGTVISGRSIPVVGVENSVGLYINTLPLVVDHSSHRDKQINDALCDIQRDVMMMNSRSNVELSQLHASDGELKHSLFDSIFVLESEPSFDQDRVKHIRDRLQLERKYEIEKLDYPLVVVARENQQESVNITVCYAGELFDEDRIKEMMSTMQSLFEQIAITDLDRPISCLEYVDKTQVDKFERWSRTFTNFPHKTLNQLFEEEAVASPDKIAVVFNEAKLTYRQLNERCNQLARVLLSLSDIKPDRLIALFLDKNENMIASILAVWKSGGAYVPIDPSYPRDRVEYILSDTHAKVIITNSQYVKKLKEFCGNNSAIHIVDVESTIKVASTLPVQNLDPISTPIDLAYVIYTSGTTGKPKGVMVEHLGVVNLHMSLRKTFNLKQTADEVILSFSNYVFDHFVEQMNDALLNGQTLVVLNDEMRTDKTRLYQYISDNRVTYLSGTPSVLSQYEFNGLDSIRRIDAVGEDFTESVFNKIRSSFSGLIINGYGPTEVSITSHKRLYPCRKERRSNKSIGFPVDNTYCYVLNDDMKRVPIGTTGELYIGGVGVARGYLNRPDLTSQRFINNPFQTDDDRRNGNINIRLYRTGDLARWLSNGELECLGRNDFQIKLRGIRIELGEIEAAMLSFDGISRCVVTIADSQDSSSNTLAVNDRKFLVGYFVSNLVLREFDIRRHLATKVPQYMIPNRVVQIQEIPVNVSGKLDTKRLPVVTFESLDYVAPSTEAEIRMTHIWSAVLDISADKISSTDDFFSLGGDSLASVKLSFTIANVFGMNVGVAAVFQNRTIRELCRHIIKHNDKDDQLEFPLCVHNSAKHAVVSFAQEQLLFIDEFENGTHAYNVPMFIELKQSVNRAVLKRALLSCVQRHQALRTLLPNEHAQDGVRLQKVVDYETAKKMFIIDEISVNSMTDLDALLVRDSEHVFNLSSELPLRVRFYELSRNFYLSIIAHHIFFDGWSAFVLLRDLKVFYSHYLTNSHTSSTDSDKLLPVLTVQYTDYSTWQRQRLLSGNRLQQLREYWLQKLEGFEPLNMCLDYPRGKQFDYSGRDVQFLLDCEVGEQLRSLARSLKTSVFSIFTSAYCYVLSQFTAQREIVIGVPVSNRDRMEFENMIGFFVNMVVLKVIVKSDLTVQDFISKVSEEIMMTQQHQDLPFERLVKLLRIQHDPSRHPIVQVVFGFNNFDIPGDSEFKDKKSSDLHISEYLPSEAHLKTTAKYDIYTSVTDCKGQFKFNVNFSTHLFHIKTIECFIESYRHVLKQLGSISSSGSLHKQLQELTCVEHNVKFGFERNISLANEIRIDEGTTLHYIFENSVDRFPDRVAVVCGNVELTYRELNQRSNQLAHYLRSIFNGELDQMIMLALDKNELMIIAILAVWKAGAAYVPANPNYPAERIHYMLEDTETPIVITNRSYSHLIRTAAAQRSVRLIEIDSKNTIEVISQCPVENCRTEVDGTNLAYVIYTSGSTGKPKGVLVEHGNVVNLRNDLKDRYFGCATLPDQQEAILFLSNYVFDFSVEQFILSILCSNKLIIPPSNIGIDDQQFYDYVNRNKLTFLSGTPTYLQQFNMARFEHLKILLLAGECVHGYHYEKIRTEFDGKVAVAYGVTETTVYNLVQWYTDPDSIFQNSLGQLLSNMRLYIVNENLQKLPHGAVGELCLAGRCVSRGYLNRPELTSKSFVSNPFQTTRERQAGVFDRLYKTGDLVRYTHDERLEYIGRKDQQVKIRGFRIEVGEIESVISSHKSIQQCAVVIKSQNGPLSPKFLVAYFVSSDPSHCIEDLSKYLQRKLPDYMIPRLVRVETIPTTVNGKLDVRALPEYNPSERQEIYAPPRSNEEHQVCETISTLLNVNSVGIDDDFFQLGGDSILSLQLVSELRQRHNISVSVKDIFTCRNVRLLFDHLQFNQQHSVPQVECQSERGILSGHVPLLPIQKWFFNKKLVNPNRFSMTFTVLLPRAIDVDKLKSALIELVRHHDVLRMKYVQSPETAEYEQFYESEVDDVVLTCLDINDAQCQRTLHQLQESIDIVQGPLFRVALLSGYQDDSCRLWFNVHHLVIDTVSWRIITRDLEALYDGRSLGPKKTSYRQWAQEIQRYSCQNGIDKSYWSQVHDECSRTLVADSQMWKELRTSSACGRTFALTQDQTTRLLSTTHRLCDARVDDLLLTALGLALRSTVTGCSVNWVLLEGHGREQQQFDGRTDITTTVGWFTTMYPLRIETPKVIDDIEPAIVGVRNSRKQIPSCNGLGYGALLGYDDHCLPRVTFNNLGRLDAGAAASCKRWVIDSSHVIEAGLPRHQNDDGGKSSNPAVIDVTSLTVDGQLRINVTSFLETKKADKFVNEFHRHLVDIVDHTCSCTPPPVTCDVGYNPASGNADFIPYFEFNEHLTEAPVLFMLPPGEGGAESYFQNIVRHLTTVRLVVFNNFYRHFNASFGIPQTFEQLAPIYLQHVRDIQPHGPYHFLGWSFGGLLALEMSLQLARDDEAGVDKVANLVTIDSYFDVSEACRELGLPDSVLDRIHHVYHPDEGVIRRAVDSGNIANVILFKAREENSFYRTDEQRLLFKHYSHDSKYNRLDSLLDPSDIELVEMADDSHVTWTGNGDQVDAICRLLEERMLSKNSSDVVLDHGREKTLLTRSYSSH